MHDHETHVHACVACGGVLNVLHPTQAAQDADGRYRHATPECAPVATRDYAERMWSEVVGA